MMKHENITKPLTLGGSQPTPAKRGLWRKNATETPLEARSPITKAFDFLPWARHKKSTEKQQQSPVINTAAVSTRNSTTAAQDEKKDAVIHYHRNIFRNGGGIIRDLLGDKLIKDKSVHSSHHNTNINYDHHNNNKDGSTYTNAQAEKSMPQSPNPGQQHKRQRKLKQMMTRNKSLDINELIDCVEHELSSEKRKNGHIRFLDDTFIENIMRAKGQYQRSLMAKEDVYRYADNGDDYNGKADAYYTADNTYHYTSTPPQSSGKTSPKHILFNDENTVYLIKKELPVKRELSKASVAARNVPSSGKHERDSVLKARLKFKKYTPEANSMPESKSSQVQSSHYPPAMEPCTKRSFLQRQNTSPVGSCTVVETSPVVMRRHHQLYQRAQDPTRSLRRRSLTETSFEQAFFNNSSSSSMGSGNSDGAPSLGGYNGGEKLSGNAGAGGSGGGIINERPKTDKPRKKLSFREPIVAAEKERNRRRSSPLQRTMGLSGLLSGNNGGIAAGVSGLTNDSPNNSISNINNKNAISNTVCDNLNVLQDNRFAATNSIDCGFVPIIDTESQAMRIVRTVGQAFEVCHKFNLHKNSLEQNDEQRSDVSSDLLDVEHILSDEQQFSEEDVGKKERMVVTPDLNAQPPPHPHAQRPNHLELVPQANLNMRKSPNIMSDEEKSPTTSSSPSREIHKLKDQLEQQALQTRQALAQLMLVREQLISETNARIEAQARTQQLLQQNRELLEHLASLGAYSEQQAAGLTSANIAMAPQSQLQMLLQATGTNNNNLATINQQISNLGSINQQLTSLSHQLSGLNQQSQNLQNFQNLNASQGQQQQQQQTQQQHSLAPLTPSGGLHQSQLSLNVSSANGNASSSASNTLASSAYPSMNQLQNISNQLQHINAQSSQQQQQQQQQQQDALSKDLFQVNQELLSRLQALNLGAGISNGLGLNGSTMSTAQQTPSPHSSFFFVNPMSCSPSNNNNAATNYNYLNTPSSMGNLTPSPMGTLNRNSYVSSPMNDEMRLSLDKNLNSLENALASAVSNSNIAAGGTCDNSRSSSTIDAPSSPMSRSGNDIQPPRYNTVMLKVTDEAGNVTNQRKLSATPSFITRSTSEKVPNRSQIMSQVQRTAWARHTTK